MATSFDPNKNPYADDLLRLSRVPKSRFTTRERHLSACMLAGKLYGLEVGLESRFYWLAYEFDWRENGPLLFTANNRRVWVEVIFESAPPDRRLRDLEYFENLIARDGLEGQVLVLNVGTNGVRELHNGKWKKSWSLDIIAARLLLPNGRGSLDDQDSDSIPPMSDEEASSAYFGSGDNGDGGGLRRGGGGGGGGNGGGEDGGRGDQTPGAGGVRELLNHPVLFTGDEKTLRTILDNA